MSQKQLLYYRLLPTATRTASPAQGNSNTCHRNSSSTSGYYQQLQEKLHQLKETAAHVIETALLPVITSSYKNSFNRSRKQLHMS
jgi:hypothetical protein